jgi:hypothetical protein
VPQRKKKTVAEKRAYIVKTVADAKSLATNWLRGYQLDKATSFGLPEVDDRYHIWRVPLKKPRGRALGEVVIDAYTGEVDVSRTTRPEIVEARILRKDASTVEKKAKQKYQVSALRNTIGFGDCVELMSGMPTESVDLIFTSPPYFNARPQYSEYDEYQSYLLYMKSVIKAG